MQEVVARLQVVGVVAGLQQVVGVVARLQVVGVLAGLQLAVAGVEWWNVKSRGKLKSNKITN